MSKAREYAERVAAARKVPLGFAIKTPECGSAKFCASVDEWGGCEMRGTVPIDEMPRFLAWLRDTFGEGG